MEVWLCEGAARLNAGHIQGLHRAFEGHVRADGPEAAEVAGSHQQGGGLAHGPNIQLAEERQKNHKWLKKKKQSARVWSD